MNEKSTPQVVENKDGLPSLKELNLKLEEFVSPEKLMKAWDHIKSLFKDALEKVGESEKSTAVELIGKLAKLLEKNLNLSPKYKIYLDEIYELFEESETISQNTNRLLAMDESELREEFASYEKLNLSEAQKNCLSGLELMSKLTSAIKDKALSLGNRSGALLLDQMNAMQKNIGLGFGKLYKNKNPKMADLLPDSTFLAFQNPRMFLDGSIMTSNAVFSFGKDSFPPIDFKQLNSAEDLKNLELKVVRAMGAIGNFAEASLMIAETIPKDVLAESKKAVQAELAIKLSQVKSETFFRLYKESRSNLSSVSDEDLQRALQEGSENSALMLKDSLEADLILKHLGKIGFEPSNKEMWDIARNMFDVQNEWTKVSDANMSLFIDSSIQIAVLSASIVVPELLAAHAVGNLAVLGTLSIHALRSSRYPAQAQKMLRLAGLGAETIRTLGMIGKAGGKLGEISSHLLASGAISEVSAQNLLAIGNRQDLEKTMSETPWVQNIVVNALISGIFSISITKGKWPPSLPAELMANGASRAVIASMKTLFQAGFRPVCASLFAGAVKEDTFTGDTSLLVKELGPELLELGKS